MAERVTWMLVALILTYFSTASTQLSLCVADLLLYTIQLRA